jgi:hypothetical protein
LVDAAAALTAAGHMAAAPSPAAGMAAAAHFGGGLAAIPPVPVAPRRSTGLVLYCLLAAAALGLVALATSKLLSVGDQAASDRPTVAAGAVPGTGPSRIGTAGPLPSAAPIAARHAAPRGRGHNPVAPP